MMLPSPSSLSSLIATGLLLLTLQLIVPVIHATSTASSNQRPFKVAMIPKFDGLVVFDQALSGAYDAYLELTNPGDEHVLEYLAPPSSEGSGAAQMDRIQTASLQGFDAVLLSNNAQDDIVQATIPATTDTGLQVLTWDSPIPMGVAGGEQLFVSQVDFDETGQVLADMVLQTALSQSGDDGSGGKHEFAILSSSEKAANQNAWIESMSRIMQADQEKYGNLELVEIVFGDDDDAVSYDRTMYFLETYPNLELIMSPTTVGISAASRAVTDRNKCADVKVVGLGLPAEMVDYTLSGCAPVFALWSFVDLGYLTYYAAYRLVYEKAFSVSMPGASFDAGRLGTFTVERDPTRPNVEAYRIIMGGFTLYNKDNVQAAVFYDAVQGDGGQESFEQRFIDKFKKKAIAIIPKVTGMISFVSSGYIIWSILTEAKRRRLTKYRLLVGISIHDMIASFFGFFLSTWPIPADTWLVYGNVGTTQSCTMQGFFFQAGLGAGPFYSAALTTFYLLSIVFEKSTDKIVRKWEPMLHAIPIAFGWGTAIAGLPLTLYNSADRVAFMCWIAEFPAFCSLRDRCERGTNANIYRWAFLYIWIFVVFIYMTVSMTWIYHKVLSVERATDRWTNASGQRRRRNQSKKVAAQGLQYVLAFIFPWIFGITVSIMLNQVYGDVSASARLSNAIIVLEVVNAIVWPLKGFFTFLAYMRPHRKSRGEDGRTSTASSQQRRSTDESSQVETSATFVAARKRLKMSFKSFLSRSAQAKALREQRRSTRSSTASVETDTWQHNGEVQILPFVEDDLGSGKGPQGAADVLGSIDEEASSEVHLGVTAGGSDDVSKGAADAIGSIKEESSSEMHLAGTAEGSDGLSTLDSNKPKDQG